MGLSSDSHYRKWANSVAESAGRQYSGLWDELVKQHRHVSSTLGDMKGPRAFFDGLLFAYCLLTGDDHKAVERAVAAEARELVRS
jgi:hypothetical protein